MATEVQTVIAFQALAYTLATAVVAWATLRDDDDFVRKVGLAVTAVTGVSAAGAVLTIAGLGEFQIFPGYALDAPQLVDDVVAYGLLFVVTTALAGTSTRYVGLVSGLSVFSRLAIEVGVALAALLQAPVIALFSLVISVLTYVLRVYLLWGPVARDAAAVRDDREVLFQKCRNILMTVMGLNIVSVLFISAGLITVTGQLYTATYFNLLLRVGFVAFIVANVDTLRAMTDDSQAADRPAYGSPATD